MSTQSTEDAEYRLPTNISPAHYDLTLFTDLEAHRFFGTVEIQITVHEPTIRVVLNAADLNISAVSVTLADEQTTLVPVSEAIDTLTEHATFLFPTALPAGTARLFIAFAANLTSSMVGYYLSRTSGPDDPASYCALTQFAPTSARRAFPCWDEPALKATFTMSLIARTDTVSISNMPACDEAPCDPEEELGRVFPLPGEEHGDDEDEDAPASASKWKITRFQDTPVMSTYLVAFANGAFAHIESEFSSPLSGRTVPLRIYATPQNLTQAGFALEVTARVLPVYEQIFGIEYPLPKLDTLVVNDFDAFAMENWGLITGRASGYLLADPSMLRVQKEIVALQSHEVAHMWFGNITTMSWWTYLYLNEGFATLVGEAIVADRIWPEWNLNAEFVNVHAEKAFSLDSGRLSHAVEVACPDANKINQIFDGLAYSKSASVLRMLSSFVGEGKFLKGISLYLKDGLYGNRTTVDLWKGVEKTTGVKVSEIMDAWISKPGFPVVTVEDAEGGVNVRQERYLRTGYTPESTIWAIPLQILSIDNTGNVSIDPNVILHERQQFIPVDTKRLFKLNAGSTGYYRVLYSSNRLKAIGVEAAKENSLFSGADRVGLVNDAFAVARINDAMELVWALRAEKEYHVWVAIASNLVKLKSMWWEDQRIGELLDAFRRSLFLPIVARLGYRPNPSESSNDTLLRTCAITEALATGDEGVANELKVYFTHFLATNDDAGIPSELVTSVYTAAVRHGGRQEYDAMKSLCTRAKNPAYQISAMTALCAANDPEMIEETVRFILSGDVRNQDIMYFIDGLAQNIRTRRRGARFFMDNFEEIRERFTDGFGLGELLELAFNTFAAETDRDELVAFFKDKDTSKFALTLLQVLDSIEGNTACLKRSTEDLLQWLQNWTRQ